jgi:hypothetical protein
MWLDRVALASRNRPRSVGGRLSSYPSRRVIYITSWNAKFLGVLPICLGLIRQRLKARDRTAFGRQRSPNFGLTPANKSGTMLRMASTRAQGPLDSFLNGRSATSIFRSRRDQTIATNDRYTASDNENGTQTCNHTSESCNRFFKS